MLLLAYGLVERNIAQRQIKMSAFQPLEITAKPRLKLEKC